MGNVRNPLEGPATHLRLVLNVCRSYETKPDFAGPFFEILTVGVVPELRLTSLYFLHNFITSRAIIPEPPGVQNKWRVLSYLFHRFHSFNVAT
jgi:hypothetical protein